MAYGGHFLAGAKNNACANKATPGLLPFSGAWLHVYIVLRFHLPPDGNWLGVYLSRFFPFTFLRGWLT